MLEPTLYTVKAIIVLDNEGSRIIGKYFDDYIFPTIKEQRAFEKNLFKKTFRSNAEILLFDELSIVLQTSVDLHFYVVGSTSVNEGMLKTVLSCFVDSLGILLHDSTEKKTLMTNLDVVLLALDEVCDNGIILETESRHVVDRVGRRDEGITSSSLTGGTTEQVVTQLLRTAKDQMLK
ncbi:hypothetical protein SNEBB_009705 [Seison nebaliae]|nr:hypothetical protein SNEBB_009705 [Seison nebaliae]